MKGLSRFLSTVAAATLVVGCASSPDEADEATGETEDALESGPSTRSVDLKYEGTCAFLRNCSSWSRGLRPGTVRWGCEGVAECSDSGLWVAGPTRSYCGKTVRICRGERCVNAKVRDVSVSRDWEASNGVLDGLDLDHRLYGECSGAGGGRVTVSVN
jgi:hypothetical protein